MNSLDELILLECRMRPMGNDGNGPFVRLFELLLSLWWRLWEEEEWWLDDEALLLAEDPWLP